MGLIKHSLNNFSVHLGIILLLCFCCQASSLTAVLTEGYGLPMDLLFRNCCHNGSLPELLLVINQYKKQETPCSFSPEEIRRSLKDIVSGGFDSLLLQMRHLCDLSRVDEDLQKELMDLALEIGYPNTVRILQKLGVPLTWEQNNEFHALQEAFSLTFYPSELKNGEFDKEAPQIFCPRRAAVLIDTTQALDKKSEVMPTTSKTNFSVPLGIDISPPLPINQMHYEAHGGERNQQLFQREYRSSVLYTLYRIQKDECSFKQLIECLGHRRRHMASLGQLGGVEFYGVPTDQHAYTPFDPIYAEYKERIDKKYSPLPKTVIAPLNGREVCLTQMTPTQWIHPKGDHREEILDKIDGMCRYVHANRYPKEKTRELAYDLGKIIWWMSHAPPFSRGTPTIIAMLMDAFWIYHGREPLIKKPDLNCEALVWDNEEEFALYLYNREDLPG